jgi:hypothetical protein
LPLQDRRASIEREEREYRRRLEELRGAEASRMAAKDLALAELRRRADLRERRKLFGTAWWRCA